MLVYFVCSFFAFLLNLLTFEEIGYMHAEIFGCKVCAFWVHLYGAVGSMYAAVGCMSAETLGLLGADFWHEL